MVRSRCFTKCDFIISEIRLRWRRKSLSFSKLSEITVIFGLPGNWETLHGPPCHQLMELCYVVTFEH
ncbi:hypothetical protein Pfo_015956 [Paulownia fortunei]|nr:hypothetical protein Pfo_015956 [Paulownia fortunei]